MNETFAPFGRFARTNAHLLLSLAFTMACCWVGTLSAGAQAPNAASLGNQAGASVSSLSRTNDAKWIKETQNLSYNEKQIATLLLQVIDPFAPLPPEEFFKRLGEIGGDKPMVTLNHLKTRLGQLGLSEMCLGKQTELGGSLAEATLLEYRRQLTLEGIKHALTVVKGQNSRWPSDKFYLAKIGKWAGQNPNAFTFAGDIDFTFLSSDKATARALVAAFDAFVKDRLKMSMGQLDSVATAHGEGSHLVYVGRQGEQYGDNTMIDEGPKLVDPTKSGIIEIDFNNLKQTFENFDSNSGGVIGELALMEVLLGSVTRRLGPDVATAERDAEFIRQWEEKRSQTVEPFLSMELVRHFEADIVKQIDVFTVFDLIKKASKYLFRSNDIFQKDFEAAPADAKWAKFVYEIDQMAAGKWPEGSPKRGSRDSQGAPVRPTPSDIMKFADEFFKAQPELEGLFKLIHRPDGTDELIARPEGLRNFLAGCQKRMWENVAKGFDARIKMLLDLHAQYDETRLTTMVEQNGKTIKEMIAMFVKGLEAMKHDNSTIPREVVAKAETLLKLVESLPRTARFKLPAGDIERLRELLKICGEKPPPEGFRAVTVAYLNKADQWATDQYTRYEQAVARSEWVGPPLNKTALYIDAVNSILDFADDWTLRGLRESGIIEFEYAKGLVDADGKPLLDADGKPLPRRVTLLKVESIKTINDRLQKSILGKFGNNTAFKAMNLANEANAYYQALVTAKTPWQAFNQFSMEFCRQRIPGFSSVESLAMGEFGLGSLRAAYLIFPQAAMVEAVCGIASTVCDFAVTTYWSTELTFFVDGLYRDAVFQQKDPATGKDSKRWFLYSITRSGQSFSRADLKTDRCVFLADPELNTLLTKNLAATDPFLTLMEELKNHEAVGIKVRERFDRQIKDRWEKLKKSFVLKMIEQLESRKSAEDADAKGEADSIYADLMRIAGELEIAEKVNKGMDEEWGSNNLKRFQKWLINIKRTIMPNDLSVNPVLSVGSLADPLSQPLTETERTKAIEIVMRYRDGYRTILETRGRIEEALEQWCSAAGLRAPQNVQDNLRLLTGLAFLTGNLDQDARVAAQWTTQLAPIRQRVDNELLTIKRRVIEDATLNDPKDREFGAKIAFEDVWIKALRGVGSRNILWDTHVSPVVGRREKARARLIADYEALYGGATRTLVINVRQEAPAPKVAGGTLPLPTAKVSLERERKTVSLTREGESDFVARHIKSGTYSLRVAAVGFRSETGAADFQQDIVVPSDTNALVPAVKVMMVPTGNVQALDVMIEPRDSTGAELTGDPVTMKDTEPISLIARVTEKPDGGQLTFNWAAGERVLGSSESKAIPFSGEWLAGTVSTITLVVIDEKGREGKAEIHIKVIAGKDMDVMFDDHRPEIFRDENEIINVTAPVAADLKYRWQIAEQGGGVIEDLGGDRRFLVNGLKYPGKTLLITLTVTDADGRTGKGETGIVVRDEDAPTKLEVKLIASPDTIDESDSATVVAAATPLSDSGTIQYSWDDGVTFGGRTADRCLGSGHAGQGISVTVLARDQKGRTGKASCLVQVRSKAEKPDGKGAGVITIQAPQQVMATDIFPGRAKIPASITNYSWLGPLVVKGQGTPDAELQFRPTDQGTRSVWIEAGDTRSAEVGVSITPAVFSGSGSDLWTGGPTPGGFSLKRKPVSQKRTNPLNFAFEPGKTVDSGTVGADLTVAWSDDFGPATDAELEASLRKMGFQLVWRRTETDPDVRAVSIGDFKGYMAESKGIADSWRGSGYQDLWYPEVGAAGSGIVRKGKVAIRFSYRVSGSGLGAGWWDDLPFMKSQAAIAKAEVRAIIAGLKIGPDGKFTSFPHAVVKITPTPDNSRKFKVGEKITLRAEVENPPPGVDPNTFIYSWTDHVGSSDTIACALLKPGKQTISVTVEGIGAASVTLEVEEIKVVVEPVPPLKDRTLPVGSRPGFGARLISGGQDIAGEFVYHWQPHPEVPFEPYEGPTPQTVATLTRPGTVKIWVEVLAKQGEVQTTVAKSEQIELNVVNPKLTMAFDPVAPLVGQEVKAQITAVPDMDPKNLDFRWTPLPSNGKQTMESQDAREITFYLKDDKPMQVSASARTTFHGDDLGEVKGTITARKHEVKVSGPKIRGPTPQEWKEGQGLVDVTRGVKVHQTVSFSVSVAPKAFHEPVTYEWTTSSDACHLHSTITQEPNVTCSEPGTYTLTVVARDANDVELGRGSGSLTVGAEPSQQPPQPPQSPNAAQAAAKVAQAKTAVANGDLDQGISLAGQAAALDPKNPDAANLQSRWLGEKQQVVQSIGRMDQALGKSDTKQAAVELAAAQQLQPKYAPVVAAAARLDKAVAEANQREANAQKLVNEGYALEKAGKSAEAAAKYEQAVALVPNEAVSGRIKALNAAGGPKEAPGFAGAWQSDWGTVTLNVRGTEVRGTFTQKDGTLEGTLSSDGRTLSGWWTRQPNRQPPVNAGAFQFTLAPDGKTFTGTWRYGKLGSGGTLNGTRLPATGPKAEPTSPPATPVPGPTPTPAPTPGTTQESPKPPTTPTNEQRAQALVNEGYALEQKGDLQGAIGKFEAAAQALPDAGVAKHIQDLKARLSKQAAAQASPASPPLTPAAPAAAHTAGGAVAKSDAAAATCYPVDLSPVGGKKGVVHKGRNIDVDDASWIRLKGTGEKRLTLTVPLPSPLPATAVALIANLDDANSLPQDSLIATLTVIGADGSQQPLEIRAGVHVSEWNTADGCQHKRVAELDLGGSHFMSVFDLTSRVQVKAVRFDYVASDPKVWWWGNAPGFCLRGITLIDGATPERTRAAGRAGVGSAAGGKTEPPYDSRVASALQGAVVLDASAPGGIQRWRTAHNPPDMNPKFTCEEVFSSVDGSALIRTRAVGATIATCETKSIRRVYDTGPRNSSDVCLEAYIDFTFNGTEYNLPSVMIELLDENDRPLGSQTYFGKGVIGGYNRSRLPITKYVELPSATGTHRIDLSGIGPNIRFSKIAVYLANYVCVGENSVTFGRLVLRGTGASGGAPSGSPSADAPTQTAPAPASVPPARDTRSLTGTYEFTKDGITARLVLQQDGNRFTGMYTASGAASFQHACKGTISGNRLQFEDEEGKTSAEAVAEISDDYRILRMPSPEGVIELRRQ